MSALRLRSGRGEKTVTNPRFARCNCSHRSRGDPFRFAGRLQAHAASPWATDAEFQKQLSRPTDVVWAGNPLRQALRQPFSREANGDAAGSTRRSRAEDRRQICDVPLRAALQQIAEKHGLGVSILGSVIYVGPAEAAARLRTLAALRADDARRLPLPAARKFQRTKPMHWNDLAAPRGLLTKLAEENGLELTGLDLVPHDLWAAADLPPLSLTDRLTLMAVQFDLTFDVQSAGAGLRLAPLPRRVALTRNYPGGADPAATARRLAALAPARGNPGRRRPGPRSRPGRGPRADRAAAAGGRPARNRPRRPATIWRGSDSPSPCRKSRSARSCNSWRRNGGLNWPSTKRRWRRRGFRWTGRFLSTSAKRRPTNCCGRSPTAAA